MQSDAAGIDDVEVWPQSTAGQEDLRQQRRPRQEWTHSNLWRKYRLHNLELRKLNDGKYRFDWILKKNLFI